MTYTQSAAAVDRARSREVMISLVSLVGAERNQVATALRDAGKVEEARDMFRSNATYLQQNADKFDDSRLRLDAVANNEASQNLDDEEWKRERKKQRELQHKTQTQRVWTQDQKKD